VSTDGSDWQGEGSEESEGPTDRPYGARPYGARPYGARPYGARPYGARPYGARPYGARPYGARPYGARPYGARPYGARPYGARPYGARPYLESGHGGFDPAEWGEDICELALSRSAVVTLGATVASSDEELWIPAATPTAIFRGTAPPVPPPTAVAISLNPREERLEAWVSVPDALFRHLGENPEVADALKSDLADSLARGADAAFLDGPRPPLPGRIGALAGLTPTGSLLSMVLSIVAEIRGKPSVDFRSAGWILHPRTLDALTRFVPPAPDDAPTLKEFCLLKLDGADGGMLVGLPFVTSEAVAVREAAEPRIYFAADWGDAWVGVAGTPVTVDTPVEPSVTSEVVIRASMALDFALRRDDGFAWADVPWPD
jgi:hypothetical protein